MIGVGPMKMMRWTAPALLLLLMLLLLRGRRHHEVLRQIGWLLLLRWGRRGLLLLLLLLSPAQVRGSRCGHHGRVVGRHRGPRERRSRMGTDGAASVLLLLLLLLLVMLLHSVHGLYEQGVDGPRVRRRSVGVADERRAAFAK